jgi:hypothetical protein
VRVLLHQLPRILAVCILAIFSLKGVAFICDLKCLITTCFKHLDEGIREESSWVFSLGNIPEVA